LEVFVAPGFFAGAFRLARFFFVAFFFMSRTLQRQSKDGQ